MNRTLAALFPGRANRTTSGRVSTPLQQALQDQITVLTSRPEVKEAGIAQFLPLLQSALTQTSDDDIRAGREMMRELVRSLDAADTQGFATETGSADDAYRGNGDGQDDPSEVSASAR